MALAVCEPLNSRACNTALCDVKSASSQCAVRLNKDSGQWSELQMSVVKLTTFAFSTCAAIHVNFFMHLGYSKHNKLGYLFCYSQSLFAVPWEFVMLYKSFGQHCLFEGARGLLFLCLGRLVKIIMLVFVMVLQMRDEVGCIKLSRLCTTTGNLCMTSFAATSFSDSMEKYRHTADITSPCYFISSSKHTLLLWSRRLCMHPIHRAQVITAGAAG